MKLNFWQWLGVILVVIGAIGYVMFRDKPKPKPAPMPDSSAVTEIPPPATVPAQPAPAAH